MADRVGQQLGNYQLIRSLGEGSFAEVYLGEHIHLGTHAAIKVLRTQLTSEDVDKFRTEARTIAHLIHPHIVRVLEFGVEGKTPFLVMDYAPNGTLRQRHPKGVALPLPLIVIYVKQVADALQYAHDEKLIHRDIKPENMLLGRRNDILLSDFGIALVAQSSRYQSTQEMAGTMAYMAPEQIQGKPRPASDQYSLGIVVYEWLSGDRPFHGSLTELVGQHLSVPPPSLQEKVSTISPEVDRAVLTALAKDPKQRFASIQAFAIVLEQTSQSVQPASSVVASPTIQLLQSEVEAPSSKQPSPPLDAVATILPDPSSHPTNIVTPSNELLQSPDRVTPPSQSLQPTNVVTPSSSVLQPTVAATPIHAPAVPPPSTEESIPTSKPQPSKHRISRRAMVVGLTTLVATGSSVTWLALHQPSSHPAKTPVPTTRPSSTPTPTPIPLGTTLLTYSGHSSSVRSVAWSPDGTRIASGADDPDNTVQVWDAVTGQTISTYRGNLISTLATQKNPSAVNGFMNFVGWLPNSKRIVSEFDWIPAVPNSNLYSYNTVQMWDAISGQRIWAHTERENTNTSLTWNAMALSPDGTRIVVAYSAQTPAGGVVRPLQIWDAATGSFLFNKSASQLVGPAIWSPDGTRIALASNGIQIWEVATWSIALTYRDGASTMAWSPDNKHIASDYDNTVRVWDVITGNTTLTYSGHSQSQEINCVAWSPDGKRIASGGDDGTVQIWDATTGNHIYTLNSKTSAVAWSPDSTRIVSAGDQVQVWKAV